VETPPIVDSSLGGIAGGNLEQWDKMIHNDP
jgi:hypothetical protein